MSTFSEVELEALAFVAQHIEDSSFGSEAEMAFFRPIVVSALERELQFLESSLGTSDINSQDHRECMFHRNMLMRLAARLP